MAKGAPLGALPRKMSRSWVMARRASEVTSQLPGAKAIWRVVMISRAACATPSETVREENSSFSDCGRSATFGASGLPPSAWAKPVPAEASKARAATARRRRLLRWRVV